MPGAAHRRPYLPVGVMAKTERCAESLAHELGIPKPVALSPRTTIRGIDLGALIVDEGCWPMSDRLKAEVIPTLKRHLGYILVAHRYDPGQL